LPETIKIRFILSQNPQDFGGSKSPALSEICRSEGRSPERGGKRKLYKLAAELKQQQTFEIILPNLIHKSKKRNLKKK